MAQQCGFFNAEYHDGEYDRVYNAEQFAAYFASFIGNGIFGDSMEELVVLARTENNMSVDVSTGQAWINGWWYRNDETLNMPIALADGILNRKDIVVLRWGNAERDMWLQVLQGEPSIEAVPPVIRRDADYFDLELCEIDVPAGTSKITQALIKDTRLDNNVCGFVTGVVDQIDTTALYLQFNQQFGDWFEAVKEQFEGDVPQILQSQIDDLFGIISDRIETSSTSTHDYLNKDYFIYANKLCKATKSIAIGDTISPGTESGDNCIYTTIIDEIGTGGGSVTVVEELADIEAMTQFNGEAAGAKAVKNLSLAFSNALTALKNTTIAQVVGATGNTFTAVIQKLATIASPGRNTSVKWADNILKVVEGSLGARATCSDGVVRSVFELPQGWYGSHDGTRDLLGITDAKIQQLGWVIPSGNKNITANGNYDVTDYASVIVNVHTTPSATVISAYTPTPTGPGPHSLNVPAGYSRYLFSIISNSGSGDTTCTGCGATRIAHVSPSGGQCLDTYLLTSSGTISFTGKNWVPSVTLIGLNS